MLYCGLDVATVSSSFCIKDDAGEVRARGRTETTREALKRTFSRFVKGGLKIAFEAGNQSAWLYDFLVELGAEVVVVNAKKVRLIAESTQKTDDADARTLCDLLRLGGIPTVHMPCQESREVRGLLVARRQLLRARAKLCNTVGGFLRQEGIRLKARELSTFQGWARLRDGQYKGAHLLLVIEAYAEAFERLTRSIQRMDKELKKRAAADPRVELLRTMPLVGLIGTLTLLSAVDVVDRFPTSRKLVSYTGLAPSVRQSGERCVYGPITREGRGELRSIWVQIAHLVVMDRGKDTGRLRAWYGKVAAHRGKKTAIVALARKLLCIAYQILKAGRGFDPKRVSRAA
jgi:transposase